MNDMLKTLRFFIIIVFIFYILAYGFLFFIKYILPLIILYILIMKLLNFLNIKFKYKKQNSEVDKSDNDIIDAEFEDLD